MTRNDVIQIECGVQLCQYAGSISEFGADPTEESPALLEEHGILRHYLRESGWLSIMIGEVVSEVWICPVCQEMMTRARETQEG